MIIIDKIKIDIYQDADNELGSEQAEIIVNPALIGLFDDKGNNDYYYTFKSEHGFTFEEGEIEKLFKKIESIVKLAK